MSQAPPPPRVASAGVSRGRGVACTSLALLAFLFAIAFPIAPRACRGGLELYAWLAVACLALLFALPFTFKVPRRVPVRVLAALGLVVLGVLAWFAGLVVADVPIFCRLF